MRVQLTENGWSRGEGVRSCSYAWPGYDNEYRPRYSYVSGLRLVVLG